MANILEIVIRAKNLADKELAKVDKSLGQVGKAGSELSRGLGGLVKGITGLNVASLGAVGAITGVGVVLGKAIQEAADAEKVMAQTEAVIKATGMAAGMTADEIAELALAESRLTSVDDEVVQGGLNMLLTFKGIGEETLPRATRAMQDMAVAMAGGDASMTDLSGTAIQLGKALNDPLTGLTALQRVGVTFTQAQEDAIKAMVEANDVAGAQAIILAELESEFGGAAKAAGSTFTGEVRKLTNEWNNLLEALGTEILPPISDLLHQINEFAVGNKVAQRLTEIQQQVGETRNWSNYKIAVQSTNKVQQEGAQILRNYMLQKIDEEEALKQTEQLAKKYNVAVEQTTKQLDYASLGYKLVFGAASEAAEITGEYTQILIESGMAAEDAAKANEQITDAFADLSPYAKEVAFQLFQTGLGAKEAADKALEMTYATGEAARAVSKMREELDKAATSAFFDVDMDFGATAAEAIDVLGFKAAGGEAGAALVEEIKMALVKGQITEPEARAYLEQVIVAAAGIQVTLGEVETRDAV